MKLTSSAFAVGTPIPKKFTCDGENGSPALAWSDPPAGTREFALVMEDPDAPPGNWIHWVLFGLAPTLTGLEEGVSKKEALPNGSRQGLCYGVTESEFDRVGYYGPCPPPGKPHRYYFRLYALKVMLNLPPKTNAMELRRAMKGNILAEAETMGTYERK